MSGSPHALAFRHTVAIAGSVYDAATLAPIARAQVEIVAWPPAFAPLRRPSPSRPGRPPRDRTQSQGDGIFVFVDLPPGSYTLRAHAPHLGTRYGEAALAGLQVPARAPGTPPPPPLRADLALPPTRLAGLVTHQQSGAPVPGARVHLLGSALVAWTSDAGGFVLAGFSLAQPSGAAAPGGAPPGLRLQVSAPGFAPQELRVTPVIGQETGVAIALAPQRPTRIAGRVTRQGSSHPVPGARLRLVAPGGVTLAPLAFSSAQGDYQIEIDAQRLGAEPPHLEVTARGFQPWQQPLQLAAGELHTVHAALQPV